MTNRTDEDYRRLYEQCLREKDQLQTQFNEFQTSSTEFEEELQRELTQAHTETEKAKARIAKLETLVSSIREEAEKAADRSTAEIQALSRSAKDWEAKCMQMRLDMRLMEQEKDNLERNCRVAEARAADLEMQVEHLEEQCALLQDDVASAQEDHEEELRTMREELKDARSDLIRAQAAIPNQNDTIKSLQRQVAELQNQLEKLMIRHASSPSQSSRKSRSPNTSAHSRQLSSPVPPLHDNVAASVVSALHRRSSVAEPVGRGRSSSIEDRREAEERAKGKATLEVPSSAPGRPALGRPATISFPQHAGSSSRVPEFTANGLSHSVPAPSARRLGAVPRQPSIPEDTIEEEPANHSSDGRPFIYLGGSADSHAARAHVFSPMPTTPRSPAPPPPMASRTHSEPSVMDQPTLTPSIQVRESHVLDPMLSPTSRSAEPRDIPTSLSVLRRMLSLGPGALNRSLSRSSNGTTPEPQMELAGLSLSPANTEDSRNFTSPLPTRIPDVHTRLPMPNLSRKFSESSDDGAGPVPSFAPPRPPGVTQLNFNQMMPSPSSVAKPMPLSRLGKSSTQSALLSRGTPRKPIDRSSVFPLSQVIEAFTPRSAHTTSAPNMVSAGEALLNERLAALRVAAGNVSRQSSDPDLPPPSSSPPPPPLPHHPPSMRNLNQPPAPPSRAAR